MSIDGRNNLDPFEGSQSGSISLPRSGLSAEKTFSATRVDWIETPVAHVFKVDLPGVKKEEVQVEVLEGILLKISGDRMRDKDVETDIWHLVERSSGSFLRCFRLPENTKADGVMKATMDNGVLTVTVPKEVKKRMPKCIEISG